MIENDFKASAALYPRTLGGVSMQTLVTSVYEPSVSDEPYETGEETTVYTFAELDESAKEKAREWSPCCNP